MTWSINEGIILNTKNPLASSESQPSDIFIVNCSMFRGLNDIRWYSRNPHSVMLNNCGSHKIYSVGLKLKDETKTLHDIKCILKTPTWNYKVSAMEYVFIPLINYELKNYIKISIGKECSINDVMAAIVKAIGGFEYDGLIDKTIKYKEFYEEGIAENIISDICKENNLEWVAFKDGIIVKEGIINNGNVPNLYENVNNTIVKMSTIVQNDYIVAGSVGDTMSELCSNVTFGGSGNGSVSEYYRVIWFQYHYSRRGVKSSFVCNDTNISEQDYCSYLSDYNSTYLLNKLQSDNYTFVSKINKISQDKFGIDHKSIETPIGNDINKLTFETKDAVDVRVAQSMPYAGETVGIQFPENKDAVEICVSPYSQKHMATSVGQLFQGKTPTRKSTDDFRLTLPDGGSIYYDKADGSMILAAKTKLKIGVQSGISSTTPVEPDNFIEIDGDGDTFTLSKNGATITINNVGAIILTPKSGQTVQAGGNTNINSSTHTHAHIHSHISLGPGVPTNPAVPDSTIASTDYLNTTKGA